MIKHLQIETITGCNAKCTMCPVPTLTRPTGMMDSFLFYNLVDQAVDLGIPEIVPFLNGEPLADRRIPDFLSYIVDAGATTHLTTNGSLLDVHNAHRLAEIPLQKITISVMGGTKEAYERVMKLDYEKTMSRIDYFLEIAPYPVYIYMTEFEDNAGTIAAFSTRWGDRAVMGKYANWAGKRPSSFEMHSRPRPCERVMDRMVVLSDGRVALCCLDPEGEVVLGHARYDPLRYIWYRQATRRQMHRELNFDMPLCRDCNWNR